jgi:phosphate transport system protein
MTQPTAHTVKSFDDDLRQLRALIGEMGGLAKDQIDRSTAALVERNAELAEAVIESDSRIDRIEAEVEQLAIATIARRAPMADDLRDIIAALKISAVIERIGDYAKNNAKRATSIAQDSPIRPVVIVPEMARIVSQMVHDALDAYACRDEVLARDVWRRDANVDEFYNSLFRALLTFMMENPHHITPSTHLLFIAKNLERIGDHATNIAEVVHYTATGDHLADRHKADETVYTRHEDITDRGGGGA